ncbi:MAG TPA: CGNR zinc finger domain-containing protein [Amycolatopsis sp.]|jgi:predicted RNA-binding Zn ribbon-like protein|nr:CGNR zinc finger domain-containing protein [Amycolatopsis sp.]
MQVVLDDYVWAAGVATELVNTTAEVWRGDEHLPDLAALTGFVNEHPSPAAHALGDRRVTGDTLAGLATRARPTDLDDVHALRVVVRDLIDHPERDRLVAGASALTASVAGVTLLAEPAEPVARTRIHWAIALRPSATITDALAVICGVGVLGVVHALGEQRFRQCGAPACCGAFIDTTRPGRRRYCMPGLCGNRVNVANHRARRAAARAGKP